MHESPRFLLDHVAIGVRAVDAAAPFLVGDLGGRPVGSGPGVGFRFWQWEYEGGGRIEVLEPDGPPGGFLHRFLDRRGPGVHHVTFKVPSLEAAVRRAAALGYEVVGVSTEWPGWKEAFLHPKQAQGIVVQLAESHPELEPPEVPRYAYPQVASPAREPVRLLGLRLAAHDALRARRQWGELLGAAVEERGAELVFRWPDSPLRIAVAPGAAADEGPLCLEVAARHGLALPEGPHPALGTAFVAAAS
jgi:catechol 2,3-dioxygenase-like lactoylglutathione lyase family enzyme